ncbi:HD-GYP domain-containing protein [Sedimenticola sp.]|uniref:HD-GYP domain-containing protein n=1 Tax=Sedimenticola sp. TaxID=1940285 RepID=UPI003D0D3B2F
MNDPFHSLQLDPGSRALGVALGERDRYTHYHSRRVAGISRLIGLACDLGLAELAALELSAFFHDIGKIGIPDHILLKPDGFTEEEMAVMKHHPVKGEGIVKELGLEDGDLVARVVRHHHEHFDGGGYPDGLQGEAIPVLSRIISVADSYDAMTKTRPYHDARPKTEALDIMFSEAGSKLDPYLVHKIQHLAEVG